MRVLRKRNSDGKGVRSSTLVTAPVRRQESNWPAWLLLALVGAAFLVGAIRRRPVRSRRPVVAPADMQPASRSVGVVPFLLFGVIVGAALRFANLAGVPPALNQDEAIYGYDAYSLLLTGRDHLGHPFTLAALETFGDWSSPLLTFLEIPAIALFGLSVGTARGVSALVGVLAIPVMYLLAVELFGRRSIGAVTAWLVALLPWHVHLSRWAIIPTVVPTMVALTLFLLARAAHHRSQRLIVAASAVAGLTVLAYHAMEPYVPLLGILFVFVYLRDLLKIKPEALLYAVLVLVLIAGPALYLTYFDPGGRARLEQVSIFRQQEDVGPRLLAQQYLAYFSPQFLFVTGDGNPMHQPPGYGLLPPTMFGPLIAGAAWLLYCVVRPPTGKARRTALLLFGALLLYPVPGSITLPNPQTLRAAHVIPLLTLVAAVGAVALFDAVKRLLAEAHPWAAAGALTVAVGGLSGAYGTELWSRYTSYFVEYPRATASTWQYGVEQALSYAREHQGEYDEVWLADTTGHYAYVLFYNRWPPSDAHEKLLVRRDPPRFNQVDSLGVYRFGDPPGINSEDLALLHTVTTPSGAPAYEVRGGETATRGKLLLVHQP